MIKRCISCHKTYNNASENYLCDFCAIVNYSEPESIELTEELRLAIGIGSIIDIIGTIPNNIRMEQYKIFFNTN